MTTPWRVLVWRSLKTVELHTICDKPLEFCLKMIALGDHAKTTKIQNMLPVFINGLMARLSEFCENIQNEI